MLEKRLIDNIKFFLIAFEIKQNELAERIGIHKNSVSLWLRRKAGIDQKTVERIAAVYDFDPGFFYQEHTLEDFKHLKERNDRKGVPGFLEVMEAEGDIERATHKMEHHHEVLGQKLDTLVELMKQQIDLTNQQLSLSERHDNKLDELKKNLQDLAEAEGVEIGDEDCDGSSIKHL